MKNILILCDAHDCIRHEGNHSLLLKQLYVTAFIFKGLDQNVNLQINSRGIIGFESFWKKDSPLVQFLSKHITHLNWTEINVLNYDMILIHPDYQKPVLEWLGKAANVHEKVFSFLELQFNCKMYFKSASTIFSKNGLCAFDRSEKNELALSLFKKEFDECISRMNMNKQEAILFPILSSLVEQNKIQTFENIKSVLILDDFKRPFFIGDAVHWLSKIKKLINVFNDITSFNLNIANTVAFEPISKTFKNSVKKNVTITDLQWLNIDFSKYDLILCNNDIFLKLYWYLGAQKNNKYLKAKLQSFSVMDDRPISENPTFDFYINIHKHNYPEQIVARAKKSICNELSLLDEEVTWARQWLEDRGLKPKQKLVFLIHGASAPDKVILDAELIKFLKRLSGLDEDVKVVLVTEKSISTYKWLFAAIEEFDHPNLILADALGLRDVMSLMASKSTSAIIGPCTGLMHLADGIYTDLINSQVIKLSECPLMLVYAGQQAPERNYHPNHWWRNSKLVSCLVNMKSTNGHAHKILVPLEDCPVDFHHFNAESLSASDINGDMLFSFMLRKVQRFHHLVPTTTEHDSKTDDQIIPTFIISLKHRLERQEHVLKEFANKPIFQCNIVPAIEDKNGRLGLWKSIKNILSAVSSKNHDFILICEDDHQFTNSYSEKVMHSAIQEAKELKAEILLGGICFCDQNVKRVSHHVLSVDNFACTQFMFIFKSFYNKILEAPFSENDCADLKISDITNRKLVVYPFISHQKDFGYSDVSSGYFENKMLNNFNKTSSIIERIIG